MLTELGRAWLPSRIRAPLGRWVKPIRPAVGRIKLSLDSGVRRMTDRLAGLKDAYRGHRCFIMGNGPSLNRTPLHLLTGEYVWGSNRCYLLFNRIAWRPSFYTAVDTRVVPDVAAEIRALTRQLPRTLFFFPLRIRLQGLLRSRRNVYWYNEIHNMDRPHSPCEAFSTDASQWVSAVRTVTVAALQLAVHLGFNPIYLIGCDTSYTVPGSVLRDGATPDNLTSTANDDPNHFDPNYFGKGRRWHEPHPERMIEHYEEAKVVCDERGVKVLNATVGGKLEVFPRVDFGDLF